MADTIHTISVQSGVATEYFYTYAPAATNDKLKLIFDKEFSIDDIIIDVTGTIQVDVFLTYPISQQQIVLAQNNTSDWYLNQGSSSRKLWFRVPAGTNLEISTDSVTGGSLQVCVIGR